MQISSRFTIGTHMMIIIAMQDTDSKVTSDFLMASVGVNPVIIRGETFVANSKKSRIDFSCSVGRRYSEIIKDLQDISPFDVYQAVECLGKSGKLFSFHDNPNPNCPVGLIFIRSWIRNCWISK